MFLVDTDRAGNLAMVKAASGKGVSGAESRSIAM